MKAATPTGSLKAREHTSGAMGRSIGENSRMDCVSEGECGSSGRKNTKVIM